MLNRIQLPDEIKKWHEENIISKEQEDILLERYSVKPQQNHSRLIISIAGAILVCTGAVIIITSIRNYIPVFIKTISAFIPLDAAFAINIFIVLKKYDNTYFREAGALIYSISILCTIKLTEWLYMTPENYVRFIICCCIMTFPLIFLLKSRVAVGFVLFYILNFGIIYSENSKSIFSGLIVTIALAVITSLILLYIHKISKASFDFSHVISEWIASASLFTLSIIFSNVLNADIGVVLFINFSFLYILTGKDSEKLSPLSTAGTAGSFVMLLLYSLGAIESIVTEPCIPGSAYLILLCIASAIVFFINKNKNLRKTVLLIASMLLSVSSVLTSYLTDNDKNPFFVEISISVLLLIFGIIYISDGIKQNKISFLNIGMISICAVLFSFFENSFTSSITGLLIVILGLTLISANLILIKKQRKDNLLSKEAENEK